MKKLDNADKKTKDAIYKSISDIINNRIIETSVNLDNLNKVTVQNRQFNTVEVIKALDDFSNDAIINNLYFDKIDSKAAENIKNNFATKRLLTNIANIVLTLVGLSYIPKLYASSDISSSAKKLMQAQKQTQNDNEEQISFKGSKNINNNGIFSAIGKILTKYIPEKFNEMMEYVGYNFTKTTFIALSFFGLLAPRMKRAYERAQVMLNGKKDMTEINEILLRDTVASLTVVFAVPILTKMFVNHFEQKSGFVLTNRASKDKSPLKKFLDVINPYSKLDVLSIKDLEALYAKVDSKNKLINFANFINNKGGDLYAIISKSDNVHEVFNENSCKLDSLKNLALKERNEKIISIFKNIKASDIQVENEIVSRLMKSSGKIVDNKIFQFAKNYNSIPAFVSTFLISPLLLGVIIPSITYRNTRKAHEKMVLVSK